MPDKYLCELYVFNACMVLDLSTAQFAPYSTGFYYFIAFYAIFIRV